jgi:hypothetical protein
VDVVPFLSALNEPLPPIKLSVVIYNQNRKNQKAAKVNKLKAVNTPYEGFFVSFPVKSKRSTLVNGTLE